MLQEETDAVQLPVLWGAVCFKAGILVQAQDYCPAATPLLRLQNRKARMTSSFKFDRYIKKPVCSSSSSPLVLTFIGFGLYSVPFTSVISRGLGPGET